LRPYRHGITGTAATQCSLLLGVVLVGVMFCRQVPVIFGMGKVCVGNVRVVRGAEVIACFMMLRGFRMVVRCQSVVMSGLLMMLYCLL
jgi:hypothetical protein